MALQHVFAVLSFKTFLNAWHGSKLKFEFWNQSLYQTKTKSQVSDNNNTSLSNVYNICFVEK